MSDILSLWHAMTLFEQFWSGVTLIVAALVVLIAAGVCGPVLVGAARDLFPDETFEDDEQRLVEARARRRAELLREVHQVDAAADRALFKAIASMPAPRREPPAAIHPFIKPSTRIH